MCLWPSGRFCKYSSLDGCSSAIDDEDGRMIASASSKRAESSDGWAVVVGMDHARKLGDATVRPCEQLRGHLREVGRLVLHELCDLRRVRVPQFAGNLMFLI